MPKTIYATTKPGWYDTRAIAKGKWLQQLNSPSNVSAGLVATPDTHNPGHADTKLRVLQKILARSQLSSLYTDLVSHWKLDDLNYRDSVGTNHLSAVGTPVLQAGKVHAQAVTFPSDNIPQVDHYLTISSNTDLQANTNFTFAGWFYHLIDAAINGTIIYKTGEYMLVADATAIYTQVQGSPSGSTVNGASVARPTINQWHFFVYSYNTSTKVFTVQVDLTRVSEVLGGWVPGDSIAVGAGDFSVGFFLPARLQSISLWHRLLTDAEITNLWNNGAGRAYPF